VDTRAVRRPWPGTAAKSVSRLRPFADAVALLALGLVVAGGILAILNRHSTLKPFGDSAGGAPWGDLIEAFAFGVAGWALARRRPDVVFGWLALAAAVGLGAAVTGVGSAVRSLDVGGGKGGAEWGLWCGQWGSTIEPLILVTTWAAFPGGRLPGGWVRWLSLASIGLCSLGALHGVFGPFEPGDASPQFRHFHNPLGTDLAPGFPNVPLFAGGLTLGSIVIVVRWRQATGELRRVLRWLGVVNVASILTVPFVVLLPAGELLSKVGTVVELILVCAVVLATNVYGIDVVLNRTLVYVLLTAIVIAVYSIGVALISALGLAAGGQWRIVAAVGAAFSLAPAQRRVQRLINRFLYGDRDDPYAVLTRVSLGLQAAGSTEHLLPRLLEAIIDTLRLPYARIELCAEDGWPREICSGTLTTDCLRFPLLHQGSEVGALIVGLRHGQPVLQPRESDLIDGIARQVAVAVANVGLTEELIRSRERILVAGEEERRRLRRDLHDGLGPVLTAAANKLDAARNVAAHDLARADGLLAAVRHDLGAALDDLRRLVYALRPPILDELGLLAALGEQMRGVAVAVVLSVPDALPELPAAVEIAAYRIVTEAVTNVGRHAAASRCDVSIEHGQRLVIDIRDNGGGGTPWKPGVGLSSMQERAAALGGSWHAGPTALGGRVHVELPLSLAAGV
jgi:signal transduction histidine kinase